MLGRISAEPVAFWGLVTAAFEAVIGLLVLFDVFALTSEQMAGTLIAVAVAGSFLTFFVRNQTTPLANPQTNDGVALVPEA